MKKPIKILQYYFNKLLLTLNIWLYVDYIIYINQHLQNSFKFIYQIIEIFFLQLYLIFKKIQFQVNNHILRSLQKQDKIGLNCPMIKNNIEYFLCKNSGYHQGQSLNIVCLESACKGTMLCCCACVQQSHQNHQTKTLKKILMEADNTYKSINGYKKQKSKSTTFNTDIMSNIVQNYQTSLLNQFKALKQKFLLQIEHIEKQLKAYYKDLYFKITQSQYSDEQIKTKLAQYIQQVYGSNSTEKLTEKLSSLLLAMKVADKLVTQKNNDQIKPDQQSYLHFLKNSNIEISEIIDKKFKVIYSNLEKQTKKLKKITPKINNFWQNSLYKFSPLMHHPEIDVLTPFLIRAKLDSAYQIALMSPAITYQNECQSFRFRINACDLEWVAVGVCYKSIAQSTDYKFKFDDNSHGCYLISGNGGVWSHHDQNFNNCVKAFKFKQGDFVTCTVFKDKICFIKDVSNHQFSIGYHQRQYFQLLINQNIKDQMHPCVVSYYRNTQVQYLPSFGSQLKKEDMPVFKYKFSQKWKPNNVVIINQNYATSYEPSEYKCCILDNAIESNGPQNQLKSVTFRISRSTDGWIGIGLCHKNVIINQNYHFNFQNQGHGCYMISSNGGSWSCIQQAANNVVRTFKFVEGDLITCTLDQKNTKIIFKKSFDSYQLKYEKLNGDKLHPVVVLYFPDDQVEVLPQF